MNFQKTIKKIEDLADFDDCGVDSISPYDYQKYIIHWNSCQYCQARNLVNTIGEDLRHFLKTFNISEEQ